MLSKEMDLITQNSQLPSMRKLQVAATTCKFRERQKLQGTRECQLNGIRRGLLILQGLKVVQLQGTPHRHAHAKARPRSPWTSSVARCDSQSVTT